MASRPERRLARLAGRLEVSVRSLTGLLADPEKQYHRFAIRHSNGKKRWIAAPSRRLKQLQRRLLQEVLYERKPHDAAHGFAPGRSIVTNASLHVGRAWVLTLDIENFFGTTTAAAIEAVLSRFPELTDPERAAILRLVTLDGVLPQGAPTSPHLANLAFEELDETLSELAASRELGYSRYADDLTFSGEAIERGLVREVAAVLLEGRYVLAEHKTRLRGQHQRQEVTGLVVNEKVALPRALRRWLRAVLHDVRRKGAAAALSRSVMATEARLAGYLALQMMIDPEATLRQLEELVGGEEG